MKYNTQEIERIANRVSALSTSVTEAANGRLRRASDELPAHLKGETAVELSTALQGLFKDVLTCGNNLSKVAEMLHTYARILKLADEASRANIIGK